MPIWAIPDAPTDSGAEGLSRWSPDRARFGGVMIRNSDRHTRHPSAVWQTLSLIPPATRIGHHPHEQTDKDSEEYDL